MGVDDSKSEVPISKEAALEAYNEVVAKSDLLEICLISSKFKFDTEFYDFRQKEKDSDSSVTNRQFGLEVDDMAFKSEEGILGGKFHWSVMIKKGNKHLFKVDACYLVVYRNVPSVHEEPAFAFLRKVGKFASYPYFRTLVSVFASNSRADIPPLPVLK